MSGTAPSPAGRRRLMAFLPLILFAALALVFFIMLTSGRNAAVVPSVLIGKQAPVTSLAPLLPDKPGIESVDFGGKITLLNIWASWCGPCRQEHPLLMALSEDKRLVITGLNYKDKAENARSFLTELGDPYHAIGVDGDGRAGIEWGVYGVPETFLIGRDGTVLYKHVGPLTPQSVERLLMPEINKAFAADAVPG